MKRYQSHLLTRGRGARSQDRCAIFTRPEGLIVVVAAGAGGSARGEAAAEAVIAAIATQRELPTAAEHRALLARLDTQLWRLGGEATAVVASVSARGVEGASVGDSIAWLITSGERRDLTAQQERKPLLGSREATPVAFRADVEEGTLLLASDGLWRYVTETSLCEVLRYCSLEVASAQLLKAAQLPSGALQDDLSLILCALA